jgi:hypothetical protein
MKQNLKLGLCLVAVWALGVSLVGAQGARMEAYQNALQGKMNSMMTGGAKCKVNLMDSQSGEGVDVELRITMPINAFMEFAPVAALEAAALPHKFPAVYIFLREETTDRVGRIAFADAEPIAGKYLAGDKKVATEEMKNKIRWH